MVVGPCSIHDPTAAIDYAHRLAAARTQVRGQLLLVMRAYFEKPRTTVGWKGLINDPYLDDSFHIADGLEIARRLLLDIAELGLPLSTEALDPITPQYLQDLIAWSAIGARTTESQTHREMASGLSSPVGFKNGTDGGLEVASERAAVSVPPTQFSRYQRLRSGVGAADPWQSGCTHRAAWGFPRARTSRLSSIAECEAGAAAHGLANQHHGGLQPCQFQQGPQPAATGCPRCGWRQIAAGNRSLIGLMIESNLKAGNQKLSANPREMAYGVSVTDACIDWETTEALLLEVAGSLADVLPARRQAAA